MIRVEEIHIAGVTTDAVTLFNVAALLAALAFAFAARRDGDGWAGRAERAFGRFARGRARAVVLVFLLAFLGRLALLPLLPPPVPNVHDEFSYLLAADTFARGRLANPPHPLWPHFESFHIIQRPTHASMYPPAQGLFLALGKILFGHAWLGAVLSAALMCAAMCWMLQGWLPPRWALAGGLFAVMRLGLVGYWVNSYWGGAVAAIGGALVLGALPRISRRARPRDALALASGLALLANSRPYEGLVLGLTVGAALVVRSLGRRGPSLSTVLKHVALPIAVSLAAVACAMTFYFWRVTGDPLRMPYQVNREAYAVAKHFPWQTPRPAPAYRHDVMRDFYLGWELDAYAKARADFSAASAWYVARRAWRVADGAGGFLLGPLLVIPLVMLPRVLSDRRTRFLLVACAVTIFGLSIEVWFSTHYAAPLTAALYAISLQGARHLYVLPRRRGRRVGRSFVRALLPLCALLFAVGLASKQSSFCTLPEWPWARCGEEPESALNRSRTLAAIGGEEGKHLAIVRYAPGHNIHDEWVYNDADVDAAKVVWAREMGAVENERLLEYFKDRRAWLVEPDAVPAKVSPYTTAPRAGP